MVRIREGEKREVAFKVTRSRGSGTWTLTTPQYRVLNSSRGAIAGYDWATATWDDATDELYALFDSSAAALAQVGTYYVQLRGTIGTERYQGEVVVQVIEAGP